MLFIQTTDIVLGSGYKIEHHLWIFCFIDEEIEA